VDSGAAGNIIQQTLDSSLNIPSYPRSSPFLVQALDNCPLGSGTITHITTPFTLTVESVHQENIPFFITCALAQKIILGLPWLQHHNPTISWSKMRITDWSPECRRTCFPVPSHVIAPMVWDVDVDILQAL
jgi:hypothetical protein